jgi:hypothetical protein
MKARHILDIDAMEPLDGFAPMAPERTLEPANDNQPISRTLDKLFGTALAIELEAAKEAGALGFMARAMVQATMPHRCVAGNEFTRTNGAFSLTMLAPSKIGLPYGSIPRLVTGFLTTEAVRTKERHIVLGSSLSRFMAELDRGGPGNLHSGMSGLSA